MMLMFTLYDVKAAVHSAPFVAPTVGVARRICHTAAGDPETQMGLYPSDFMLFHIGDFDEITGGVRPSAPLAICTLSDLLVRPPTAAQEVDPDVR